MMDTTCSYFLFEAIREDDEEELKALLDQGGLVNDSDPYDDVTPLMFAARRGNRACLKILLDAGANIELRDRRKNTALLHAVKGRRNDTSCVKLLLDAGADKNVKSMESALVCAIKSRNTNAAKMLIERGSNGKSPAALEIAIKSYNNDFVKFLVDSGAGVDFEDNENRTPLIIAIESKNNSALEMLLESGASVDFMNKDGETPLYFAICNETGWQPLLDYGASVNTAVREKTPLMYAIGSGCSDIVKALLDHGACVDTIGSHGKTMLMRAAGEGDHKILQQILQVGGNLINMKDSKGYTAPMYLAFDNSSAAEGRTVEDTTATMKMLLESGESINNVAHNGDTALLLATKMGNIHIMEMILKFDFHEINSVDKNGNTALMYLMNSFSCVIRNGWESIVDNLLEKGASVNTVANDGETPLSILFLLMNHKSGSLARGSLMINKLIDHGAVISPHVFKYLYKAISLKWNDLVQKMILQGCLRLQAPCSTYLHNSKLLPRSPLEVAFLSNNGEAFCYFFDNRLLTAADVSHVNKRFEDMIMDEENNTQRHQLAVISEDDQEQYDTFHDVTLQEKTKKLAWTLTQEPLSLFTLSFVVVSCALELEGEEGKPSNIDTATNLNEEHKVNTSSTCLNSEKRQPRRLTRNEKVEKLPLPPLIKEALLFKTPAAFSDPASWGAAVLRDVAVDDEYDGGLRQDEEEEDSDGWDFHDYEDTLHFFESDSD